MTSQPQNPRTGAQTAKLAPEELLEHGAWLRRLVTGLVGEADADDVLQATWLSALEKPPRVEGNIRGWLATVARNLVHRRRRQDERRRRREQAAARPERLRSTAEHLSELQQRRRIAEALMELDEPYRSTLCWRFLDEKSIQDIAEGQGLSASAVRSRLHRGLTLLRGRLGLPPRTSRSSLLGGWLAVRQLVSACIGGIGMTLTAHKIAGAAALVLGVAGLLYWGIPDGTANVVDTESPQLTKEVVASGKPGAASEPSVQTGRVEKQSLRTPSSVEEDALVRFEGRVVDARAVPVLGVPIRWRKLSEPVPNSGGSTESGARGRFVIQVPRRELPAAPARIEGGAVSDLQGALLIEAGEDWLTLRSWPVLSPEQDAEHESRDEWVGTIVVARKVKFSARVVDQDGRPLPGARMRVDASELPGLPKSLPRHRSLASVETVADDDGQVELDVPACPDVTLELSHPACRVWRDACPTQPVRHRLITMHREVPAELVGIVVDATGRPVAGAELHWIPGVGPSCLSGSDGRFAIPWPGRGRGGHEQLVAVQSGALPAIRKGLSPRKWLESGMPPIRMQLGAEPLSLTGRVVHADGSAATGFVVTVRGTQVLYGRRPQRSVEQLLAGRGELSPLKGFAVAKDGSFEVEGLQPGRRYIPVAFDPATQLAILGEAVQAGTGPIRLVIPREPVRERLAGRILSLRGEPLEGVRVQVLLQLYPSSEAQIRGKHVAVTDAKGRFELRDVPRYGKAWLRLSGSIVIPMAHGVESFADQESVELRTDARCPLRFEAGTPRVPGATVIFLDAGGDPVPLWTFTANRMTPKNFTVLDGTRSAEFAISERAVTLVYYLEGKERARVPLELVPGRLNRISP